MKPSLSLRSFIPPRTRRPRDPGELFNAVFSDEVLLLRGDAPSQLEHQRQLKDAVKERRREVRALKSGSAGKWDDVVKKEAEMPLPMNRQSHWERVRMRGLEEKKRREQAEVNAKEASSEWAKFESLAGGRAPRREVRPRAREASSTAKSGWAKTEPRAAGRAPRRKEAGLRAGKATKLESQAAGQTSRRVETDAIVEEASSEWAKLESQARGTTQPTKKKGKSGSGKVEVKDMKGGFDHAGTRRSSTPTSKNSTAEAKKPGFEDRILSSTAKKSLAQPRGKTSSGSGGWDWDKFYSDAPDTGRQTKGGKTKSKITKPEEIASSNGSSILNMVAKNKSAKRQPGKGNAGGGGAAWDWDRFHSDGSPDTTRQGKGGRAKSSMAKFEGIASSKGRPLSTLATKSSAGAQAQKARATSGAASDWDRFYSDGPQGGASKGQGGTTEAKAGSVADRQLMSAKASTPGQKAQDGKGGAASDWDSFYSQVVQTKEAAKNKGS